MKRRSGNAGPRVCYSSRFTAALMLAAAFMPRSAAAEAQADVPFEWTAPAGCPGRAAVLGSLAGLQRVEASSWEAFDAVSGRVIALDVGFRLDLEFRRERDVGRRSFTTWDCADLAHAAAVALALALDPTWDWSAPPAPPNAGNGSTQSAATQSVSEPQRVAPDGGDASASGGVPPVLGGAALAVSFALEGVLDPATLGGSAFGAGASARVRASSSSAEVFGFWLPTQTMAVRPGVDIELSLLAAGLRGCQWPSDTLGLCFELEAGTLAARGSAGLDAPRGARDTWLAAGTGIELSSPLSRSIALRSRVSILAPLVRPDYFLNGAEKVHEVPPLVVRFTLGAEMSLF